MLPCCCQAVPAATTAHSLARPGTPPVPTRNRCRGFGAKRVTWRAAPLRRAGIDPSDPAAIQFLWHKGADFVKAGTPIPLIFRIATIEDVKPADRVPSRRLWLTAGGGGGGQQRQRRDGSGQRQHGGGGGEAGQGDEEQARGRGRRRYKVKAAVRGGGRPAGWMHDDRGEEGQAGEVEGRGGEGDVEMQQRRRQRRPKNKRRRRGDVEMMDAEDGGGGVRPSAAAGLPCTGCVRLAAMRVARMERVPHKRPALAACRSRRATQSCWRASSARPPCFHVLSLIWPCVLPPSRSMQRAPSRSASGGTTTMTTTGSVPRGQRRQPAWLDRSASRSVTATYEPDPQNPTACLHWRPRPCLAFLPAMPPRPHCLGTGLTLATGRAAVLPKEVECTNE